MAESGDGPVADTTAKRLAEQEAEAAAQVVEVAEGLATATTAEVDHLNEEPEAAALPRVPARPPADPLAKEPAPAGTAPATAAPAQIAPPAQEDAAEEVPAEHPADPLAKERAPAGTASAAAAPAQIAQPAQEDAAEEEAEVMEVSLEDDESPPTTTNPLQGMRPLNIPPHGWSDSHFGLSTDQLAVAAATPPGSARLRPPADDAWQVEAAAEPAPGAADYRTSLLEYVDLLRAPRCPELRLSRVSDWRTFYQRWHVVYVDASLAWLVLFLLERSRAHFHGFFLWALLEFILFLFAICVVATIFVVLGHLAWFRIMRRSDPMGRPDRMLLSAVYIFAPLIGLQLYLALFEVGHLFGILACVVEAVPACMLSFACARLPAGPDEEMAASPGMMALPATTGSLAVPLREGAGALAPADV